jgi:hypothetical protein
MRATTAISWLSVIGSLACANRGMVAPDRDGGPGSGGTLANAGRGGGGSGGRGGGAGAGATGGTGGGTGGQPSGTAGNCNAATTDGGSGGGACGTMFNFESGIHGAIINSGSTAFTMVRQSGSFTFCGAGALAITGLFSGNSGPTTKGEVLISLPGAPVDLTGKTITVHVASDPGCNQDLNLSLVLNTQAGAIYFVPDFPILRVTNTWKTGMATVPAVAGSTSALALSLQAISQTGYLGTIYIDEIDIR